MNGLKNKNEQQIEKQKGITPCAAPENYKKTIISAPLVASKLYFPICRKCPVASATLGETSMNLGGSCYEKSNGKSLPPLCLR